MKKINAEIIADSINTQGDRITTMLVTFPRFILAELNTHRMFSKNSASSRAIPFEKMVKMVKEDPFIPIAWQKDHKGMQGTEYITDQKHIDFSIANWIIASRSAISDAKELNRKIFRHKSLDDKGEVVSNGISKQLCNRLLEPFMWHTVLITATEWDNFFNLRCPQYEITWYPLNRPEALEPSVSTFYSKKDAIKNLGEVCSNWLENDWRSNNYSQAEIHMQALAESMWNAMNESIPNQLEADEWHIPFGNKIKFSFSFSSRHSEEQYKIKIATARCARLSYMTFDNEIDYEKDIQLHDKLLSSGHFSCFEHCAKAMNNQQYKQFIKGKVYRELNNYDYIEIPLNVEGWCNNFKGFIQYRYLIENK